MFDLFRGLPVHALVVHGVVVLVPLASLGLIAIALKPAWRRPYAPLVALVATAGLVMVPLAIKSGEALKARLHAGGLVAKQINYHQSMGNLVLPATVLMWLAALAMLVLVRRRAQGRLMTVVTVLAVVTALIALGQVVVTGDLGSTAVWGCTLNAGACT